MSHAARWNRTLRYSIALLLLVTSVTCGLASWQLSAPLSAPIVFPFSESYFARALATTDDRARLNWALKATDVAPARAENWTLLAYSYEKVDKLPSLRSFNALRQSYVVGAYSPDASRWRLGYIFENWTQMPQDLRHLALQETASYITRTNGLNEAKSLSMEVTDQNGRMALAISLVALQATQHAHYLESKRAERGVAAP